MKFSGDCALRGPGCYNDCGPLWLVAFWAREFPVNLRIVVIASFLARALSVPGAEQTIHVPAEYSTIQQAIDTASPSNATVIVGPGTYFESISFRGKQITVRSESGPATTIITSPPDQYAVSFNQAEGANAQLIGFTLRDCFGGVYCQGSSPEVIGNLITNVGRGIECRSASPMVRSNEVSSCTAYAALVVGSGEALFERNVFQSSYMGVYLENAGRPTFRNNLIRRNYRQGIEIEDGTDARVVQNIITDNTGYGISWSVRPGDRGPIVVHNTIVNNGHYVGGIGVYADGIDAGVEFINNIVVGEVGFAGGQRFDSNTPVIRFNNVYSPSGQAYGGTATNMTGFNGNISMPPLFLEPEFGDYRLLAGSPAIDSGASNLIVTPDFAGVQRPVDGVGQPPATPDMGAFEYVPGPPRPPTSLMAQATETAVYLTWRTFDEVATYAVARSTNLEGPFEIVGMPTGTNLIDTAVIPNITYFYEIAGSNTLGLGLFSLPQSVKAGNHWPQTSIAEIREEEDTAARLDLLPNSFDTDGDSLSFELLSLPTHATASIAGSWVTIIPDENYFGTNAFTYTVKDGRGGAATDEVMVVTLPVNDVPLAYNAELFFLANSVSNSYALAAEDIETLILTYRITEQPKHGLFEVDTNSGIISYTPEHAFVGEDSIRFVAFDGEAESAEAMVSITVRIIDRDHDQISDEWESFWDIEDPFVDSDGDGMTNLDEYYANTSPIDPNAVFRITGVSLSANGVVEVRWLSIGGTRYRVLSADRLSEEGLLDFKEIVRSSSEEIDHAPVGSESLQTFVDSRPSSMTEARFYRIRVIASE